MSLGQELPPRGGEAPACAGSPVCDFQIWLTFFYHILFPVEATGASDLCEREVRKERQVEDLGYCPRERLGLDSDGEGSLETGTQTPGNIWNVEEEEKPMRVDDWSPLSVLGPHEHQASALAARSCD